MNKDQVIINGHWYCRLCWRRGSYEFVLDQRRAEIEHAKAVKYDMGAARIPAGMDARIRDTALMDKYPAVDCPGDVMIGKPPRTKSRKLDANCRDLDLEQGGKLTIT